jgi:predicted RNA-binding Zn-ribbon protein involved in translation (DUF1610 family)
MPQIGPDLWKSANSYFWYREYQDGRIEREFDLLTGHVNQWGGKMPEGLRVVGWLPVTPDLAQKMKAFGEFGIPTAGPSIFTRVLPGEVPIIFKEVTVYQGQRVHCKACGAVFRSESTPQTCPACGASHSWKCAKCGKLLEADTCAECNRPARPLNPFETSPEKWDEVEYFIGIEGKFVNRFTASRLITEH